MTKRLDVTSQLTQLDIHRVARQGSLSVHVADQLESLITGGKIAVGQKMPTENSLCDSFGVSRTVIREAITHLKSLGLVETRRGVGTTVLRSTAVEARPAERINPTTVEDILHVLELRLTLEPAAAEFAALRHDDEDRTRIKARHAAFIKAQAEKSLARVEDFEFHHAIARATHNPFFEQFYEQLSPSGIPRAKLLSIDINPAASERYLERVQEEHAYILEAILSRDAEAARETMFQHLNRSRNMYAQYQHAEPDEPNTKR
ncbi:FadR/GntR family transcriptional regulator [Halomonas urumqiensis]|uniref:GntR family transcriptional regulator n=1 Tax=Halomonas urumqiensis TaxID=1684789 RepID=A0A2N7UHM6_9GAMM|nr:FadR/GntR family transcriptional regulator [Halomonas urumqiensis]PMR79921.1 GntR family transcriptional regulator [Halomonas urumqiensis]PTB02054.1 FadR family transcriptional regulator [Halomonas urumqiensis]GHE21493.1 GntR family transcriptional regulator [Halomonas urumqiensis]